MIKEAIYSNIKGILKQIPGVQGSYHFLDSNISAYGRKEEISSLIKENKIVLLNPYFNMDKNNAVTRKIVHDVVLDFLEVYRTFHVRKTTAEAINLPAGASLMGHPLALLKIPSTHEEYLRLTKIRTIRKAERQGYEFKEFVWNDHLDEIFAINTSKEMRQSRVMDAWYREPVKPRHYTVEEQSYRKYYGAFKEGTLYAYSYIILCGDFAFVSHFLGHGQHLKYGIMNGLISFIVRECLRHPQIRWLKYGAISKVRPTSMHLFRKHAGFDGYATFIDLRDDQELLMFAQSVLLDRWWYI